MSENTAAVRAELDATRARLTATLDELDARIADRTARVKRVLDVKQLAADHPVPLLLAAFATGLVLARSGADRAAAHAVAEGAQDGVAKVREAVADWKEERARDREVELRAEGFADRVMENVDEEPTFMARVEGELYRVLGVDQLLGEMHEAAQGFRR